MHSCRAFIDPRNLCGSSRPGKPITSLSQNCSFPRIPIGCRERCSGVLMMDSLPSSSVVSPHRDRASWEMHFEAVIERVWRCTSSQRSSELRDALAGPDRASLEMYLEAVIERVRRCTWRPSSCELGDALGGRYRVNLEMHLESVIDRDWSTWMWSICRR